MSDLIYRAAVKEDTPAIVELIRMAGGGDVEFLFHDLMPGKTVSQHLTSIVEKKGTLLSYEKAIVAELDTGVVGLMLACAIDEPFEPTGITIPPERVEHVKPFYDLKIPGSYMLLYLGIQVSYRGRGIGYDLLKLYQQEAINRGIQSFSLQVWADNFQAIKLYESFGFQVVAQADIARHQLLPHDGGVLLMEKKID